MANKTHSLKTWPSYWHAVERGDKTFEVRQNDRGFALGDILLLRRWSAVGKTYECQGGTCDREEDAATLKCRVTYILNGAGQHGVQEGWCVLGIQLMWGNIL